VVRSLVVAIVSQSLVLRSGKEETQRQREKAFWYSQPMKATKLPSGGR